MRISVIFLKLLFHVGLLFTVAMAIPPDLLDTVVPIHYNITLSLYSDFERIFSGKSSALIEIRVKTSNISLHVYELHIEEDEILLFNNEKTKIYTLQNHSYNEEKQIMTLKFNETLSPGFYILHITYIGILCRHEGIITTCYTDESGSEKCSYMTVFDPTGARRVFPCWDVPTMKATFNISIIHRKEYTTLSNMSLRKKSNLSPGMVQTDLNTSPLISTNLLMFAIVDFPNVSDGYNTVYIWCKPQVTGHVKVAQNTAMRIKRFLIWYFNRFEQNTIMNFVVFPEFTGKAIGSSRFTICREKDIIYDEHLHFPGRKLRVATVVAQEVSHQWFEDLVKPTQWTELWLNRAFGLYFGIYALNATYKDWRMTDLFVVQIQQSALRNDIQLNVIAFAEEFDPFYSQYIYNKGFAIIHMLQHIVTRLVLRSSVIDYLDAYNTLHDVTPNDYIKILQKKLLQLKGDNYSSYYLEQVMDDWLTQRYHPVLTVRRDYEGKILITQETSTDFNTIKSTGNNVSRWQVPITYTTKSELNFHNTSTKHWLKYDDLLIEGIDWSDWIIVNIQQTGYYRVNYDFLNWIKIAQYLNSQDYKNIHVLNRAQIIDDAYYFLMNQKMQYAIFLELIKYLAREIDYIPWHSMINILSYTSPYFEFSDSILFKNHILDMLNGLLKNIGYNENSTDDDMTKALRLLATRWACKLDHDECRETAYDKLKEHLKNSEHPILPWWKEWIYCAGLKNADINTWQQLIDMIMKQNDTKSLEYLSCADDDLIIVEYLNKFFKKDQHFLWPLANKTRIKLYNSIVKRHVRKDKVLNTILMNFEKIELGAKSETEKLIHIIMNLYSDQNFEKVTTFVRNNQILGHETLKQIEQVIDLRRSQLNKYKIMFINQFEDEKDLVMSETSGLTPID